MFRTLLTALPLVVAIAAGTASRRVAVRVIAVAVIALCTLVGSGGLVAPHRLAEERLGTRQSSEWIRGARDTRDVVYTFIPVLVSCFCGLAFLALAPPRQPPRSGVQPR